MIMMTKVFDSSKAKGRLCQAIRAKVTRGQARRWYKKNQHRFKIIHLLVGKSEPDAVFFFAYA
jgi:hypothetical protein